MDDRTQRVADEIASIEAISHNTVKALSTVTTPLNVIVEIEALYGRALIG